MASVLFEKLDWRKESKQVSPHGKLAGDRLYRHVVWKPSVNH